MQAEKEPPYVHGTRAKAAVVLVNLGTPDAPTAAALRRYLKQFLSDPRVVEIPKPLWWLILNGLVLPLRSGKSAAKYASIWTEEGSPLRVHTEKQTRLLQSALDSRGHAVKVVHAMRYGSPALPEVLRDLKEQSCDSILILPAYPQYSGTTTASIFDEVFRHYAKVRNVPELRLVKHYHDHDGYVRALELSIRAHWATHGQAEKLVMSFHGVPKRTLLLGDPYHCECHKTARLLAERLQLSPDDYLVTFQSRFGKAEWLQPYTAPTVKKLAEDGVKRIDVVCPGFTSDCLETLEEIAMEVRQDFLLAGGSEFHYIPCLNERPEWISALADVVGQHIAGWSACVPPPLSEQKIAAEASRQRALQLGAAR